MPHLTVQVGDGQISINHAKKRISGPVKKRINGYLKNIVAI
jgi:hypothetical protein